MNSFTPYHHRTIHNTFSNAIIREEEICMKTLPIGTKGTAARDIDCLACTIKKGSRVTITGIDEVWPSRGYELTDEEGHRIIETGFDSIIPDEQQEYSF